VVHLSLVAAFVEGKLRQGGRGADGNDIDRIGIGLQPAQYLRRDTGVPTAILLDAYGLDPEGLSQSLELLRVALAVGWCDRRSL